MATARGPSGYGLGGPAQFGGPPVSEQTSDASPLDMIRQQTSKIEDVLDSLSEPIKP